MTVTFKFGVFTIPTRDGVFKARCYHRKTEGEREFFLVMTDGGCRYFIIEKVGNELVLQEYGFPYPIGQIWKKIDTPFSKYLKVERKYSA